MSINLFCLPCRGTAQEDQILLEDRYMCLNSNPCIDDGKLFGQNFNELKSSCLQTGKLFEDPVFPPTDESLYFSREPPFTLEWKRPLELSKDPKFFVDGPSRFDINQGELGDCWLLTAIASLSMNKRLLFRVVPTNQSFGRNYAGIFHFKFWIFGEWIDIVIDDKLPCKNGSLMFMHSKANNEYWTALLEKAYAKLNGSYEALEGGMVGEALVDFTGGVSEIINLKQNDCPTNLFTFMKKAYNLQSMLGCSILGNSRNNPKTIGLIKGHAYSITKIIHTNAITVKGYKKLSLIRIRNPWGEKEWKGKWSDGSVEWNSIPQEEKERIGLTFDEDGEFYMDYHDFKKYWTHLEICNIGPLNEDHNSNEAFFRFKGVKGQWIQGQNAGGCRNFIDTFATNPQIRFRVNDSDDGDDSNLCTIIISLMQKGRRALRDKGMGSLKIGFDLFHILNPQSIKSPLDRKFFRNKIPENCYSNTKQFDNIREVVGRFRLFPGTYCVVPSTYYPGEKGDFFLRIVSEKALIGEIHSSNV